MDSLFSNLVFEELNEDSSDEIRCASDVDRDIAVIGMSIKLPRADNLSQFWDICSAGRDCVTEFPTSRKKDIDTYLDYIDSPLKGRVYLNGAYLEEIDFFDYMFFKLTP